VCTLGVAVGPGRGGGGWAGRNGEALFAFAPG